MSVFSSNRTADIIAVNQRSAFTKDGIRIIELSSLSDLIPKRAAEAIRKELGTAVGILVLSQHVEPSFALRLVSDGAGGVGYLLKDRITDLDDFADAIRRIAKGGSVIDPAVVAVLVGRRARVPLDDLTERERAVLALMAEGRSNQAIGDRLSMARKTVEAHIANIFSKLELQPAADDHRRVLAVLAHLRGTG